MTGPEHYQAAENLLKEAAAAAQRDAAASVRILNESAQVHATLALAAGIGLLIATEAEPPSADCDAWRTAIGAQPPEK